MIDVCLLGATGSIGTQALDVVAASPSAFRVVALAGGSNAKLLAEQARALGVRRLAMADGAAAARLRAALPDAEVADGVAGVAELATTPCDIVLNGITGSAGLESTLAALGAGTPVALANKESLIVGGELVLDAAARAEKAAAAHGRSRPGLEPGAGAPALGGLRTDWLVPVDSEHSALAQCLRGAAADEVERLLVTASGGPFRGRTRDELAAVTAADALAHPTWQMGPLITVNSATLANKGQEVIEAHLLFGIGYDRIEVVVHPQSVVHGLVEFRDGATLAKLSPPDMRLPIQLALGHPRRGMHSPARIDWARTQALEFEPVAHDVFRMLGLCIAAGRAGGTAPAVLNAANEVAVEAFLAGRCGFLGIAETVEAVLDEADLGPADSLETVLDADAQARQRARLRLGAV